MFRETQTNHKSINTLFDLPRGVCFTANKPGHPAVTESTLNSFLCILMCSEVRCMAICPTAEATAKLGRQKDNVRKHRSKCMKIAKKEINHLLQEYCQSPVGYKSPVLKQKLANINKLKQHWKDSHLKFLHSDCGDWKASVQERHIYIYITVQLRVYQTTDYADL